MTNAIYPAKRAGRLQSRISPSFAWPTTPDALRKRFDTFMNEHCNGKDATKLRFVIE